MSFFFRLPRSYLAETEIALFVGLLLCELRLSLAPLQAPPPAGAGGGASFAGSGRVPGAAAAADAHAAAGRPDPGGDPGRRLPPPDDDRLVGVRVPRGPILADYAFNI